MIAPPDAIGDSGRVPMHALYEARARPYVADMLTRSLPIAGRAADK